jgi:type I site-specific restriction-modification system R (restriction) subunit
MHTAITKAFRRYHLFGFTGTPIFAANAGSGGNVAVRTTEQAFGDKLHTYTIVDAITDKNVLPFRIDYVNTIKLPRSSMTSRCRPSTPKRPCWRRSASSRSSSTRSTTSTRRRTSGHQT